MQSRFDDLSGYKRPLLWLGHGIRLAGAVDLIEPFLERWQWPFITSWQGKDMVRHDHPRFMGHAGVYGHRAANMAVRDADLIVAAGTRLALPMTGYDVAKFAPNLKKLVVVDVDGAEAAKIARNTTAYVMDAGAWIQTAMMERYYATSEWSAHCAGLKLAYPWLESPLHDDTSGYMNSYRFMERLNKWLAPDQIIVTDMGTALLCAYPMLKLNGKQRLITSTGLGEMGFGLPASIGASVATGKSVLCLNCDGGLQMNLQELATIDHLRLPIKIIVFCNGGYQMIKRSQDGLKMAHTASGDSSMRFPEWKSLCEAYRIPYMHFSKNSDLDDPMLDGHNVENCLRWLYSFDGPAMLTVEMDPAQQFGPKTEYGKSLEVMA